MVDCTALTENKNSCQGGAVGTAFLPNRSTHLKPGVTNYSVSYVPLRKQKQITVGQEWFKARHLLSCGQTYPGLSI